MGRRKKEPKSTHRKAISAAAQILFSSQGIEATTMNDIAKAAGYSKATLYVYFESKEEIISLLVFESMKKLYDYITKALEAKTDTKARYNSICEALLHYQTEFPFYYQLALDEINFDFKLACCLPEEKETFRIGEEINERLKQFLEEGIQAGDIRAEIPILPTIFAFWGMLSGLLQTAVKKEKYIQQQLGLEKSDFLTYGFETLYYSIARKKKNSDA